MPLRLSSSVRLSGSISGLLWWLHLLVKSLFSLFYYRYITFYCSSLRGMIKKNMRHFALTSKFTIKTYAWYFVRHFQIHDVKKNECATFCIHWVLSSNVSMKYVSLLTSKVQLSTTSAEGNIDKTDLYKV